MKDYLQQAEKARSKSQFKLAAKYYGLAAKNGGTEETLGFGDMLRMTGRFKEAAVSYLKVMKLAGRDRFLFADAAVGYGMAMRGMMKYGEAVKYLKLAGNIYKDGRDKEGEAFSLWTLGGFYRIKGEVKEAIKCLDRALVLYRGLKDSRNIAYALCGRGGTLRIMGRFKESLVCYKTANKYFVKAKDIFGQAYSNCGMGSANRMMGNYTLSDSLYKKAEKLYSSFNDEINYSYVLWGHGNTLLCLGEFAKAKQLAAKADRLFTKWKDYRGLVYILLLKGEIARNESKGPEAVRFFKTALSLAEKYRLKLEVLHAQTGLFLVSLKGPNPIKKYAKFNTKWQSVLKRDSILNFP